MMPQLLPAVPPESSSKLRSIFPKTACSDCRSGSTLCLNHQPTSSSGGHVANTAQKRKRAVPNILDRGDDIGDSYQWPVDWDEGSSAKGVSIGRPKYNWTPQKTRELIRLVLRTNIKFDDIPAALADESGRRPSKTTCRNHWLKIIGYQPETCRLKDRAQRQALHDSAIREFEDHRRRQNLPAKQIEESGKAQEISAQLPTRVLDRNDMLRDPENDQCSEARPSSSNLKNTAYRKPQCPEEVEDKESLPRGFLEWLKRWSGSNVFNDYPCELQACEELMETREEAEPPLHPRDPAQHRELLDTRLCAYLANFSALQKLDSDIVIGEIRRRIYAGADINEANDEGVTPLHLAVALGCIRATSFLLKHGAHGASVTHAGEDVWTFGRRASRNVLRQDCPTHGVRGLLLRQRACARIEFARLRVKFGPSGKQEPMYAKRRRKAGPAVSMRGSSADGSGTSLQQPIEHLGHPMGRDKVWLQLGSHHARVPAPVPRHLVLPTQ